MEGTFRENSRPDIISGVLEGLEAVDDGLTILVPVTLGILFADEEEFMKIASPSNTRENASQILEEEADDATNTLAEGRAVDHHPIGVRGVVADHNCILTDSTLILEEGEITVEDGLHTRLDFQKNNQIATKANGQVLHDDTIRIAKLMNMAFQEVRGEIEENIGNSLEYIIYHRHSID